MRTWPQVVRSEIHFPWSDYTPLVVSEIVHSLAHATLVHPNVPRDEAALENQAVRAVLADLTAPEPAG